MRAISNRCNNNFLAGSIRDYEQRLSSLCGHLDCLAPAALAAIVQLKLGLTWAATNDARGTWQIFQVGDPAGEAMLTLPIYAAGQVVDILAMSPSDPARVYVSTGAAPILGFAALEHARARQDKITLYEYPLQYLRAWAADRAVLLTSQSVASLDPDREIGYFPAACFLEPAARLSPALEGVGEVATTEKDFGARIAARLACEIDEINQRHRWPTVTTERKPAYEQAS